MAGSRRSGAATNAPRLLTAAGLGVAAYVHIHLAPKYDKVVGSIGLSQGMLFRSVGAIAILIALLVLASNSRAVHFAAFATAAGALTFVLIYTYGTPGPLGPIPNMHDTTWPTLKTISAASEAVATITAAALVVRRRARSTTPQTVTPTR